VEVLDDIPFDLDLAALQKGAHVVPDTDDAGAFERLVDCARRLARPKAIYRECYIDARSADAVTIEGVTFRSRALRANLSQPERVFAFVVTCGREVDSADVDADDMLGMFWLDTVKMALLGAGRAHLTSHLDRRYALAKTATMSPGAGDVTVWPIEQQRGLFSLLGDVSTRIGVELTDSFLMVPNKTVSGIRFQTESDYRSCQLCHRENCPGRSAPFDQALWDAVEHGVDP